MPLCPLMTCCKQCCTFPMYCTLTSDIVAIHCCFNQVADATEVKQLSLNQQTQTGHQCHLMLRSLWKHGPDCSGCWLCCCTCG